MNDDFSVDFALEPQSGTRLGHEEVVLELLALDKFEPSVVVVSKAWQDLAS